MQRRVGHVQIDTIAAESPKFTAPLLLIHGLWCTAAVWRRFMGYLAHRGWTCHALDLRGRSAGGAGPLATISLTDHLDDVRQVLAAVEVPPVVVGHDLGGLLALHTGAPAVRAVIALAPLVPRAIGSVPTPIASTLAARWALWRGAPLRPPTGRLRNEWLGSGAINPVPDSSRVLAEIEHDRFAPLAPGGAPTLLLAGERDPISPPHVVERLARIVGGSCGVVTGAGHAMAYEVGWETCVSQVHRWLVQALGEELLAMREDEEDDPQP